MSHGRQKYSFLVQQFQENWKTSVREHDSASGRNGYGGLTINCGRNNLQGHVHYVVRRPKNTSPRTVSSLHKFPLVPRMLATSWDATTAWMFFHSVNFHNDDTQINGLILKRNDNWLNCTTPTHRHRRSFGSSLMLRKYLGIFSFLPLMTAKMFWKQSSFQRCKNNGHKIPQLFSCDKPPLTITERLLFKGSLATTILKQFLILATYLFLHLVISSVEGHPPWWHIFQMFLNQLFPSWKNRYLKKHLQLSCKCKVIIVKMYTFEGQLCWTIFSFYGG